MNPSLYIHIPVCLKKCDYCDFFSIPAHTFPCAIPGTSRLFPLIQGLSIEIANRKKELETNCWKTVYIGGGSPSLLSPEEIGQLCTIIRGNGPSRADDGMEWTIEANPEDIGVEWLKACADGGINRLSMGIQSMNDALLAGIGRRGSRKSNLAALEKVRENWKGRLSFDLIAGLPGQTTAMLTNDINEILAYSPDHVSLYSLTIEEGTPLERRLTGSGKPVFSDENEADDIWIAGRDLLEANGFMQYEVSNFARRGFESEHNLTYWKYGSYIGAGPGATGTIISGDTACRSVNTENIAEWLLNPVNSFSTEYLNRKECIEEALLMGMRLASGISRKSFRTRFKEDILDLIGSTAAAWQRRELLSISDHSIALNREGLLFLNRFLSDCMEELCKKD